MATAPTSPSPNAKRSVGGGIFFLACLLGFLWFAVELDVFSAGTATSVLLAIQGFLSLPALILAAGYRRRWMLLSYVFSAVVVVSLAVTPWHPRKVFVRDLYSLQPGMTVDEVESVMGRYLKGAGSKWPMTTPTEYPAGIERSRATGAMMYRWNDSDWRYDSDWGLVTFANGRVTKVEFLPD
jgi:hypothetical protein